MDPFSHVAWIGGKPTLVGSSIFVHLSLEMLYVLRDSIGGVPKPEPGHRFSVGEYYLIVLDPWPIFGGLVCLRSEGGLIDFWRYWRYRLQAVAGQSYRLVRAKIVIYLWERGLAQYEAGARPEWKDIYLIAAIRGRFNRGKT